MSKLCAASLFVCLVFVACGVPDGEPVDPGGGEQPVAVAPSFDGGTLL